jgi:hypothetical protein
MDVHGEVDHVGVGEQIQLRRQELLLSINLLDAAAGEASLVSDVQA